MTLLLELMFRLRVRHSPPGCQSRCRGRLRLNREIAQISQFGSRGPTPNSDAIALSAHSARARLQSPNRLVSSRATGDSSRATGDSRRATGDLAKQSKDLSETQTVVGIQLKIRHISDSRPNRVPEAPLTGAKVLRARSNAVPSRVWGSRVMERVRAREPSRNDGREFKLPLTLSESHSGLQPRR